MIRPYNPSTDEQTLLKLWSAVFDEQWPLDPALFHREAIDVPTYRSGDHLLAEVNGQVVGFALTQVSSGKPCRGSLLALGVHPDFRRRGIGRALHKAALARFRERGAVQVQAGAGATGYLWPGVPADLPAAWPFFNALGWPTVERSFDLIRELDDYQTPDWVWERVRAYGTVIAQAKLGDAARVVDFVAREMPGWERFYSLAFREGRASDVIIAQSGAAVVGAALAENQLTRWEKRFVPPVGAPGAILTAEAAREHGIGMALTARACEVLKERGCRTAFIGWTWLVDWYGKLGYQVWQEYGMSWARLERLELVEKMHAGRVALDRALSSARPSRLVLTNGWTARDLLVHLAGWEDRIADAYQALAAGAFPDWELDRMSLDEVNALMLRVTARQAGGLPLAAARAAEERAYQRVLEIARTAPDAPLFDPQHFAWMKAVPFAEWIENNTCGHVEEHLLDWIQD